MASQAISMKSYRELDEKTPGIVFLCPQELLHPHACVGPPSTYNRHRHIDTHTEKRLFLSEVEEIN